MHRNSLLSTPQYCCLEPGTPKRGSAHLQLSMMFFCKGGRVADVSLAAAAQK